jgi:uncharacterized LabA/DUF88 family protein
MPKIPQQPKNFLEKEVSLIAYLDLANMFNWQKTLKWKFKIEDVIAGLLSISSIKAVKVYFGFDYRSIKRSKILQRYIKKAGGILRTKPVKYIKKTISEAFFFRKSTLTLFDKNMTVRLKEFIEEISKSGILIEEAKCNFDVEIALDMMDDLNEVSGLLLFSGDSDFKYPLQRSKKKDKNIYIVGVRNHVAKELFDLCDKYIDFGKLYKGEKLYK